MEEALTNKKYLLQKFEGKGGWTYARIPEVTKNKLNPFGWVVVMGSIDNYELKNYHLMPMGNGNLFLPVSAKVRKAIGKQAGDWVHVILYPDNVPVEIPEELLACLKDEPIAYKNFLSYTNSEQKAFIEWIYAAKKDETKVDRITLTIAKAAMKEKFNK